MSKKQEKHKTIKTINDFLCHGLDMHTPPTSDEEMTHVKFLQRLIEKIPTDILNTETNTCCGQAVIFKISQIYPLMTVWRQPGYLVQALVMEIYAMFGREYKDE